MTDENKTVYRTREESEIHDLTTEFYRVKKEVRASLEKPSWILASKIDGIILVTIQIGEECQCPKEFDTTAQGLKDAINYMQSAAGFCHEQGCSNLHEVTA